MTQPDPNLVILTIGAVVLVFGLVAGYVKNRLWASESLLCTLIGIAIGPAAFHIIDFAALPVARDTVVIEVARVTLALAVMGAALRLPEAYEISHGRELLILLVCGMPLIWLIGSVLTLWFLPVSLLMALLIGAVVSPTDPVIAATVVSGKLAEKSLPERVRHLLSAESGANDGLALLLVMLPVSLMTRSQGDAIGHWLGLVLLWEIVGSALLGLAIGWAAAHVLDWSIRQPFSERHSILTVGLSLALTTLAGVKLIGGDGVLAVFTAGLMLNRYVTREQTRHEHSQAAIGRFFDLPVFVLIGAVLPWQAWTEWGWPALALAFAILLLRRLPVLFLLARWLPATRTRDDILMMGWFGPIGVATTLYAMLAAHETGDDTVWEIASLIAFVSILLHGITATPLVRLYGHLAEGRSAKA